MNLQDLKDHNTRRSEIELFLEKKAREFDDLMGDNKARGSIDGWELEEDVIYVRFYETWRYGGQDYHTVILPVDVLEKEITEAAAKAKAEREKQVTERKALADKAMEESRRRQYEKLKEEFGK